MVLLLANLPSFFCYSKYIQFSLSLAIRWFLVRHCRSMVCLLLSLDHPWPSGVFVLSFCIIDPSPSILCVLSSKSLPMSSKFFWNFCWAFPHSSWNFSFLILQIDCTINVITIIYAPVFFPLNGKCLISPNPNLSHCGPVFLEWIQWGNI